MSVFVGILLVASLQDVVGYDCTYSTFATPANGGEKIPFPTDYTPLPFFNVKFDVKTRKSAFVTGATDWFKISGQRKMEMRHRVNKKNDYEAIDYMFSGDENSECSETLKNCFFKQSQLNIYDVNKSTEALSFIFIPRIEFISTGRRDGSSYRAINFKGSCKRVYAS
jgi:hypothetical protein